MAKKQNWEQRHKRCIASSRGYTNHPFVKNLVAGNYLDEKSGLC